MTNPGQYLVNPVLHSKATGKSAKCPIGAEEQVLYAFTSFLLHTTSFGMMRRLACRRGRCYYGFSHYHNSFTAVSLTNLPSQYNHGTGPGLLVKPEWTANSMKISWQFKHAKDAGIHGGC